MLTSCSTNNTNKKSRLQISVNNNGSIHNNLFCGTVLLWKLFSLNVAEMHKLLPNILASKLFVSKYNKSQLNGYCTSLRATQLYYVNNLTAKVNNILAGSMIFIWKILLNLVSLVVINIRIFYTWLLRTNTIITTDAVSIRL